MSRDKTGGNGRVIGGFKVRRRPTGPEAKPGPGVTKYPWPDMQAGVDVFTVPATGPEDRRRVQRNVQLSGRRWCQLHKPHLTCCTRQVDGGVDVWLMPKQAKP